MIVDDRRSKYVRDMQAMQAAILATTSASERGRLEQRRADYMRAFGAGEDPAPFTEAE